MWFLAISSLRFRWLSFVGIFVTVMAAATLVTATGSLLEGGIRGSVPPERLGGRRHRGRRRPGRHRGARQRRRHGRPWAATVIERVRIPTQLADEVASVPGVAEVVADVSFPAYVVVDGAPGVRARRDAVARPLVEQFRLTPFRLEEGSRADRTRRRRHRRRPGRAVPVWVSTTPRPPRCPAATSS